MAEPHFWYAFLLPTAFSLWIVVRGRDEASANAAIWLLSTLASTVSVYAGLREWIGLGSDVGVYALPVFPVAYLLAGRYRRANPALCAAGTYLSLLLVIVLTSALWIVVAPVEAGLSLGSIGAGTPINALLVIPVAAGLIAVLVARLQRDGVEMKLFRSRLKD